jgi:hypothetical protein
MGPTESIPVAEAMRRLAIVQAAKHAALGRKLTPPELDQLLEPVESLRTRQRLARERGTEQ